MRGFELPAPLKGVIPPMVTPLNGRNSLDVAGLERLVEHLLAGGVHGLFILGSTGEGPSLSDRLKHELLERVCRQVNGRVPVLVGITDSSFEESLNLAHRAADAGAEAVVLAPPFYFPLNQDDLTAYIKNMADKISLPMFLYNMPSLTDINFELSTIESLMSHPKIVGLKDSSGNMVYFHKVRQLVSRDPKFSLFMGPEELLPEAILAGAHGGVCGGANLAPQLYVRLYEAAVAGDLPLVRKLQDRVLKISSSIYAVGRSSSSYLAGLKCAMACLGICEDHLEEPLRCLSRKDRAQIQQNVNALALEFPAERANLLKFPKSN